MAYTCFNNLGLSDAQIEGIRDAIGEKIHGQVTIDDGNLHLKIFGSKNSSVDRALLIRLRSKRPGFHFVACLGNKVEHERLKMKAYLEDKGALQWSVTRGGITLQVKNQKGRNPDYGNVFYFAPNTSYSMTEIYNRRDGLGDLAVALLEKLNGVNYFSADVADWREAVETENYDENEDHMGMNVSAPTSETSQTGNQQFPPEKIGAVRNRLVFGAPGTGKSYKLEADRENYFKNNYERVTFYPTYSYAQFVGTYKPVMKGEGSDETIAYEFVPGPFLRVLVKALNEVPDADGKKKDWCLIIEEINRANAAAVFGDVFQLLDRGSNGESEYAVAASEDVKKYLEKNLTDAGKQALTALAGSADSLKIPSNMYLWATMNSADQGVFPLDTAFKRRWEFEYVGIDESAGKCVAWQVVAGGKDYSWNDVRVFINRLLSLSGVNEDKLMGPFFVKAVDNLVPAKSFESKVLMYLWEDAARMCRARLFGKIKTYSELVTVWREKGPAMFSELMKEGPPAHEDAKAASAWKSLGLTSQNTEDED